MAVEAFNPEDWVHTFNRMVFVVDKKRYAVAAVTIMLAHNNLPTVKVVIDSQGVNADPAKPEDSALAGTDTPKTPTLKELVETGNIIQNMINNSDEGRKPQLDIEVRSPAVVQRVTLNNWIVIAGGITSLAAAGHFALEVTFQHPAYAAANSTTALFNQVTHVDCPNDLAAASSNLLAAFIEAVRTYARKSVDTVGDPTSNNASLDQKTLKDLAEVTVASVNTAITVLESAVEWDNNSGSDYPFGFPGSVAKEEVDSYIRKSLWSYVGAGNASILSSFLRVVQEYELSLSGTASNDNLILSPFTPWGAAVGDIYDDEIYDMRLPAQDTHPISGVLVSYAHATQASDFGIYIPATPDADSQVSTEQATSAAGDVLAAKAGLIAPIEFHQAPGWIRDFLHYRATGAEDSPVQSDIFSSFSLVAGSLRGVGNLSDKDRELYREILSVWCRQAFLRLYRSGYGVTIGTRLMVNNNPNIKLPDGAIRPGVVLKVRSRSDNSHIFSFYVVEVSHTIDAHQKRAYTNIVGSYLRMPGGIEKAGFTKKDIESGINNPLYDATR